ncbi:MAG: sugar phosphate isomerase/epimerase [Propionibacteriaceae bacterium]|jgi:sugar phosphate isomerase/epimerase|nr:sugar phosphate isomerase/epimerase [Propionibacteriaceae bacterium]
MTNLPLITPGIPKVSMNVTTTFYGNIVNDIRIAKEAGFPGIELQSPKLYRYLNLGMSVEALLPQLDGLAVTAVGALQEDEPETFTREAHKLAKLTAAFGAPMMQMCTGPVDPEVVKDFRAGRLADNDPRYRGALGRTDRESLEHSASNTAIAADIAAEYGIGVCLEPLGWAPVNSVKQAVQILEIIDRPNVAINVDFWHFYVAGDTPADIAALDAAQIATVHVDDGIPVAPGEVPDQVHHRNVWTGGGVIPIQEWIDAVKSTGFDGWYCSEIFCAKAAELDFLEVARTLRSTLEILLA